MVKYCVVCKYRLKTGDLRSFHRIPCNVERRQKWLSSITKCVGQENILNDSVVCSDHFSRNDFLFTQGGKVYLKKSAVPEIPSCSKEDEGEISSDHLTEVSDSVQSDTSDFLLPLLESPRRKRPRYLSPEATITAGSDVSKSKTLSSSHGESDNVLSSEGTVSANSPKRLITSRIKLNNSRGVTTNKREKKMSLRDRKISLLMRTNRRLQTRISKIKNEMSVLKKNNASAESAESVLKNLVPSLLGEIIQRILRKSKEQYSPQLRAFALTLHFYSPKAYNYVREKFCNALPHPSTITKWFMSIDGSSGFSEGSLRAIEAKVTELAAQNQTVLCNCVMDEISIMKRVEWTGKKFTGYVDIDSNQERNNTCEAKEALVFLLVAINGHWKISVGYFFTAGLSGGDKADLVHRLLEFLKNVGVIVTSLTFDGAPANITMSNILGANFDDITELRNFFISPATQEKIFIFLDICHMLKLVRNALASLETLEDSDGNMIKWDYFKNLVQLQTEEGLHAGTKIKRRHIEWFREKMKVKLAAQTFSNSVADAIAFLREDMQIESFEGSLGTEKFVRIFNNLFDIFNTQSRFAKYSYKRAICNDNCDAIFSYLDYCKSYIQELKFNGQPVVTSRRKTGFLGFLISIESLKDFYKKYVTQTNLLKYVLTYKFSQDHLEIFFSVIRSKGGYCNNPTARQFENIYKRLLVRCEVKGSKNANAVAIDATSVLYVTSSITKSKSTDTDLLNSDDYLQICNDVNDIEFINSTAWHLTPYVSDVVGYVAGFVVKCLKKCVSCKQCLNTLESNESLSLLQNRKRYGNLINASSWVVEICKTAEKSVKYYTLTNEILIKNNIIHILKNHTLRHLPMNLYERFGDHALDNDLCNSHFIQLTKLILQKYFSIRIHYETSKHKDCSAKERVRSMLTKAILFKNQ